MDSLAGYVRAVRRWKWLILLITLTCTATAGLASLQLPRVYYSSAVGLVSPKQLIPASGGLNPNDPSQVPSIDQLVETYVGLINTEPVRDRLIASGIPRDTDRLKGSITAARQPNTTLIQISVTDSDPAVALSIAQKVIPAFNDSLSVLQAKVGSSPTSHLESLVPWEVPTTPPRLPISPDIGRNLTLAALASLVLAVVVALVLERLDDTIKSESDVRARLGLGVLASVLNTAPSDGVSNVDMVASRAAANPVAEQYRSLRTNLLYARASTPIKTLVVTSTIPGEGKTTTASNLAIVMAQAGNRVVLVDADFRKPSLHRVFGVSENVGLGNLIVQDRPRGELLIATEVANLRLLCSGPTPPNPSEVLGSKDMTRVLEGLKRGADLVILDTAPLAPVTDAAVLATMVDGVLLVVERGGARVVAIEKAIEGLRGIGAHIVGVVVNKARVNDVAGYYHYRYYQEALERSADSKPSVSSPRSPSRRPAPGTVRQSADSALTNAAVRLGEDGGLARTTAPQARQPPS